MSEQRSEERLEQALKAGLESLSVPKASAAFDERVIAALRRPTPWWAGSWNMLRPALSGACVALLVTLSLVQLAQRMPVSMTVSPGAVAAGPQIDIQKMLERPGLSRLGLARAWAWDGTGEIPEPPKAKDRPEREGPGERRSQAKALRIG